VIRPTVDYVQGDWVTRALFPFLDASFRLSLVETRLLGLGFLFSPPLRPPSTIATPPAATPPAATPPAAATSSTTATPPAAASADPGCLELFYIVVFASTAACHIFG
jgi:hypothetical protein